MYDTVIIGAGVVGCAIARELSRYRAPSVWSSGRGCLLRHLQGQQRHYSRRFRRSAWHEEGTDECPGQSDDGRSVPGAGFPVHRNGSLVVCTKDQDPALLQELLERGRKNGVPDLRILEREELLALEPNLAEHVSCALFAPTGGIVCPFLMTIAMAETPVPTAPSFASTAG